MSSQLTNEPTLTFPKLWESGEINGYTVHVALTEHDGFPTVLIRAICDDEQQAKDLYEQIRSQRLV